MLKDNLFRSNIWKVKYLPMEDCIIAQGKDEE